MDTHHAKTHISKEPRRFAGLVWLLGCIAAAALVMFGPWGGQPDTAPPNASAQPVPVNAPVTDGVTLHANGQATKPIEQLRLGDRVVAHNPEVTDEQREQFEDPDPLRWRTVELTMLKDNGQRLDITLLRHEMWFWLNGAEVGELVYIDLPEMGAQGLAEVLSIGLCPYLQPGEGSIVTGTFAHHASEDQPLLSISVEGSDEPIIGTSNHPFWSVDRQQFVEAGELNEGERVLAADDEARHITRITRGPPPEPVYNIEVHGEHTYFVGDLAVLVHNAYGRRPGGYRTGDTDSHSRLSPGTNRATGHTNTRADGYVQSHHGIQQEWARRWARENDIDGYSAATAPAILLKSSSGEVHAAISAAQRARRRQPGGWDNNIRQEFDISYRELIDAGMSVRDAQRVIKQNYRYFDSLGAFN